MHRAQGAVEVLEKIEGLKVVLKEYLKGVSTGAMTRVTNVPNLKTEVKN
jgi:hypothetical protein